MSSELLTSASYYTLFTSSQYARDISENTSKGDDKAQNDDKCEKDYKEDAFPPPKIGDVRSPKEEGGEEEEQFTPWVEDRWSDADYSELNGKLEKNRGRCNVSKYIAGKYEAEAGKNWDKFYERNGSNFFKDRHYLSTVFPDELAFLFDISHNQNAAVEEKASGVEGATEAFTLVEIGCGVGNAILPILEQNKHRTNKNPLKLWAFDISHVAVDLLKCDTRFLESEKQGSADAMVWDITATNGPPNPVRNEANVALLLFCLSAISPEHMERAACNVASTLRPGGTLLFRDYGRYDEAQMKLGTSRGKRLGDNFYVKHDGTRCYYFELEDLRRLFGKGGAGLEEIELGYIQRRYSNRGDQSVRRRVWVQARFRMPKR